MAEQESPYPVTEVGLAEFSRRLATSLRSPDCNVVWFLGAGCSVSSGIPTAAGLVRRWLPMLKELRTGTSSDWEGWALGEFAGLDFSRLSDSYGTIMAALFPLADDRQREVERLTTGVTPGIGYALLAVLATHPEYGPRSNTILTVNFDELAADAFYLLTEQKPLVVLHDSLAPFVRRSRARPVIVKIHGDARLSPRNTPDETAQLDPLGLSTRVGPTVLS